MKVGTMQDAGAKVKVKRSEMTCILTFAQLGEDQELGLAGV